MELTKEELSAGRKRLFKMIIGRARAAHKAARAATYVTAASQSASISKNAPRPGFLDLGQDSFKFAN